MDLALITVNKIIEMFIILMIGVTAFKTGVADHESGKKLSSILLNIISPCLIIMSYQIEFDSRLLVGLGITVGLSVVSFLLAILLAHFSIKTNGNPEAQVEKMAVVYSNCGFIGIPLVNGLLGAEGVFYVTAYITVYNIFVWSHGLILMSGKAGSFKYMVKNFIQPSTIAIVVSLLLFVFGVKLPAVLGNPLNMVGSMNTPVAMMVAGMNLAESNLLACLKRPRTYVLTFLKLIAVPLLTLAMLAIVRVDRTVALSVLIAAACPTGAMGTMFALQYHRNSNYASELFTITTVFSLLTIPLMVLASGVIL